MLDSPEVIGGTLKPDGTLELDQRPTLAPGRVQVALQPAGSPSPRGLAATIDAIRKDQQARGFVGRSAEDIEASLAEGEADYEGRFSADAGSHPPGA